MNEKVMEILKKVSKKTGSSAAEDSVKDEEYSACCQAAHMLFSEMLEEYKEGEVSWKESVEDLKKNLLAVNAPKPEKKSKKKED